VFTLHGNGVGAGIAIGIARIIHRPGQEIPQYKISQKQVSHEISRLDQAFASAGAALNAIKGQLPAEGIGEAHAILDAHLLILQDPVLSQGSRELIDGQQINAEAALQQHAEKLHRTFNKIDDPYLSSKSADLAQVIDRIQGELVNDQVGLVARHEGNYEGEVIVANDLSPADAIELKRHRISAFITNLGGPVSHTAIVANSMKIPAIVGLHGGVRYLRTGDLLVIDGMRGVVLVNPDEVALEAYRRRQLKILRRTQELNLLVNAGALTLDGVEVLLNTNIELPEDIQESESQNAAGVGCYRTEFMYMNREHFPDEEEQYGIYARVLKQTSSPVIIRTLDLGSDKQVDGGRASGAIVTNPAMGRRAIRLCLHDLGLFKPQLRAIYRAAVHGNVKMMIPMISRVDELDRLFFLLEEVKQELQYQSFDFDPDLQVGGVVEVPAVAIAADLFAPRLDFLSIGTNDLIQYTLAIDRVDDEVNYLYDPLHPSVLRLIKMTIDAGNAANIPVSMCGEMAGDVGFTRVLLGLGLRDFSMDPAAVLPVKQQIRLTDISRVRPLVDMLLKTTDPEQVQSILQRINH